MTSILTTNNYGIAIGSTNGNGAAVPHIDVRAPTSADVNYPIGTVWINKVANSVYDLTSFSSSAGSILATWTASAASSVLATLTGQTGTATPSGGNIEIAGTANQISTAASGAAVTLSLVGPYTPATYTAHGVLIGEGTSSVVATTAGTTGQVLIGSTGADPAFGALGVNSGLTAHGVLLGEGNSAIAAAAVGTNGQVLLGSTGADPAFGTLTTSTGIAYTTGAHSLAINIQQNGFAVNAASAGVALVAQNTYTATGSSQISFSLPATAAVGDTFIVASATGNTAGWLITQGASQEIWANSNHTTNGTGGTLAGAIHCSVVLMCVVANNEFIIVGGSGLTGLTFT
jgi:hypothetical protein